MRQKVIGLALSTMLFAPCSFAEAQQPGKIPLIGSLSGSSPSTSPARREAFRQGLRELGLALVAMLFALCSFAEAQQPKKVPRIGYLSASDAARESSRAEAIRLALRELGYIEGQNIAFEYRYADGKPDRLFGLAS